MNPFGTHSPPLAALIARGSEPDVLVTQAGEWGASQTVGDPNGQRHWVSPIEAKASHGLSCSPMSLDKALDYIATEPAFWIHA